MIFYLGKVEEIDDLFKKIIIITFSHFGNLPSLPEDMCFGLDPSSHTNLGYFS